VKRRVIIVAYYWPPAGGGGVQRWLKFVKYLENTNWEPILFVPDNPDYPILDETLAKEIPSNTQVVRVPIFEPFRALRKLLGKENSGISAGFINENKSSGVFNKILAWGRGNLLIPDARKYWIKPASKAILNYVSNNKVDAIISSGPPHSMHLIALNVHNKTALPWLADFRDPWVNMDNADKFKMSAWARKKHIRLERMVLEKATAVDTVSWHLSHEYEKIRLKEVKVLTNGFDHVDLEGKTSQLTNEFIVGHYGTFGDDRNPSALWQALSELCLESEEWKKRLKIRLVGPTDSSVLESIRVAQLNDNLEFIPYVKHNEVLELIMQPQVLMVILNQNANEEGRVTGKIFEYVATGNKVLGIGSPTSDCAKVIDSCLAGSMIGFKEKDSIKNFLKSSFPVELNKALNEKVMKYSRKNLTGELIEILNSMV
jgi:glycosyltransferase involved in cell wall biosynthesis